MINFIKKIKKFFGKNSTSSKNSASKTDFTSAPIVAPEISAPIVAPEISAPIVAPEISAPKTSPVAEKICLHCGKSFMPVRPNQKFCSDACGYEATKARSRAQYKLHRSPQVEKICLHCGKSFMPVRSSQKFCSDACRDEATKARSRAQYKLHRSPQFEKTCPVCGKTFKSGYSYKKFCSDKCRLEFYAEQRKSLADISKVDFSDTSVAPVKKVALTEKTCLHCGKSFMPVRPNQKFCSPFCKYEATKARRKLQRSPQFEKTCPVCGKTFNPPRNNQKFCSPECREKYHSKKRGSFYIFEEVKKTCPICGRVFRTTNQDKIFCSANCREISYKSENKSCASPKKSFQQWLDEAKQCGMSYGKYRAAIEHLGKTFEELKLSD